MNIDWAHFSPWGGLGGGALIGLAVALLWLANGRIAGVSGIFGSLLGLGIGQQAWRLAFVAGLVLAPWTWAALVPGGLPAYQQTLGGLAGWAVLITGGLLVGIGTRLARGCTSGHGVCGLARLSPRSLVAVGIFMTSGFITVFISRHGIGG